MSAPSLQDLAAAALAVLARDGARTEGEDGPRWQVVHQPPGGMKLDLSIAGPDLPSTVPGDIATPEQVMRERPWAGTCRLVVRCAGLIVLDLYWMPGAPTRIMGFSRGDWERDLLALAESGPR